jgi:S1-C subfamily serine protease
LFTDHTGRPLKLLPVPDRRELQRAIAVAGPSTVKIKGSGCGVTTAGSGVVVSAHLVLTAAHVLAGTTDSIVVDAAGGLPAIPIVVDPLSDLAVLYVAGLEDQPLQINDGPAKRGTVGVVLGYPHGGSLESSPAAVLDSYRAEGHDIYGRERIVRQILEVRAQIFPGSSGGPLVDANGTLIGMVFGQSEDQSDVGYALTSAAIREVVDTGLGLTHDGATAVSTGECLTPAG